MLVTAFIWVVATPHNALPAISKEEVKKRVSVWRDPFTILWGFSFFPTIWVVFTLAPLITFIVKGMGVAAENAGELASTVLEASYLLWSIIIGGLAYLLAKRRSGIPRNLFNTFASVQLLCFIIAFIGVLVIMNSHSLSTLLMGLVLVAVIQGTGPTFWSTPSTAYPRDIVTRAGYALGLISNSAALIGPMVSVVAGDVVVLWMLMLVMALVGCTLSFICMRIRLPIEKGGEK